MDVIIIKYNSKLIHDETLGKFGAYKIVYLGGTDLNIDTNVEYQIICKSAFLQITDKTKLSKDFWVPFKTSKLNMDEYEVKNFFSFENLPENLYELFFNT